MNAVDTCILARWVLRDDPVQAQAADAVLAQPFFLGVSVLTELVWVLGSAGGMDRSAICRVVTRLFNLPTACIQHEAELRWAVERAATRGDFADMIHLCNSTGADQFVTFDARLPRQAGDNAPVPVKVLI